jgi:hypothetical protein
MQRYFFHLFDGSDPIIDQEGSLFPNEDAALDHAIGCIRGFASNCVLSGEQVRLSSYMTIQAEDGRKIHEVVFYDVIRIRSDEEIVSRR